MNYSLNMYNELFVEEPSVESYGEDVHELIIIGHFRSLNVCAWMCVCAQARQHKVLLATVFTLIQFNLQW